MDREAEDNELNHDGRDDDDAFDDIPLHHKRPFGSGLKRKPIAFVPAQDGNLNSTDQRSRPDPSQNIADLYLSIVMPEEASASTAPGKEQVCEVCKLPLGSSPEGGSGSTAEVAVYPRKHHESSLAHQVCLAHSHPPSALDRSRMGLSYLESHGWDPDARAGLGAAQQGIQFPLKPKPKDDTLGIGVVVPKDVPKKKEKPKPLDAGRVRKMAQKEKKRVEQLQRQFYGNPDVEKYLGPGG